MLAALLLALWAYTESYPAFLLIWIGLGAATSALFYEAGFAVLALNLGLLARRGITIITLVAGFASTVFIPLLHVLIDRYGWRDTLLAMAALNIGICAVLHATGIPAAPEKPRHRDESRTVAPLTSNPRRVRLIRRTATTAPSRALPTGRARAAATRRTRTSREVRR